MAPLKSDAQLENLKCALCANSLSYFPIKTCCENLQNICGRCSVPEKSGKYIHNEAYETAAHFLQFPCRYKNEGCDQNMFPEEVPKHEETCPFQIIACPVKKRTNCDWKGSLPKLLQHCQEQHLDLFLKNGEFQMDLSESHHFDNFVEHDDMLLVTTRKFSTTDSRFLFSLRYFEHAIDVKNIDYQIIFKNKNKRLIMEQNATAFNEAQDSMDEIFLDSLKKQTIEPSQTFVKISLNKVVEEERVCSEKKLHENMLSLLKCSNCSDYVLPPVGHSVDGQIYCTECRVQLSVSNVTKNVSLDNIASLLDYPCKYLKNGCSFIAKADQMEKHQKFCSKGVYSCPVSEYINCEWRGSGEDFIIHLQHEHSNIIIPNSSTVTENTNSFASKPTQKVNSMTNTSFGNTFPQAVPVFSSNAGLFSNSTTVSIFGTNTFNSYAIPVTSHSTTLFDAKLTPQTVYPNSTTSSTIEKEELVSEKCYIISFLNHLFRLNFTVKDKIYYWAVQTIGNFDQKFKYEIEIIDATGKGKQLLAKHPCTALTKKNEVFANKEDCCFFSCRRYHIFFDSSKTFNI